MVDEKVEQYLKCKNCKRPITSIFVTPLTFDFYCECNSSYILKKKDLSEIEIQKILDYKEKLKVRSTKIIDNQPITEEGAGNSNGITPFSYPNKHDSTEEYKKRRKKKEKELIETCLERKFDYNYVKLIRQTIFDVTISDDFFQGKYCPEEILLNLSFEESGKGKVEKACEILQEVGIIEPIKEPQDIIKISLVNKEWNIRKDKLPRKSDHKPCINIITELRRLKGQEIWIGSFASLLDLDVQYIMKYIELINSLQDEEIIKVNIITEKIFGYKVKENQFNEKELKKLEKIQELEKAQIEKRRLEDLKSEQERKRKELEQEELKKREEERIKELARIEKEKEEIIRKREEERKAQELLEEVKRKEEEKRKLKKLEWQKEIKQYTLIKVLRILYNQGSIDARMLKSVGEKLGIITQSHTLKELLTLIPLSNQQIQEKIEVIIDIVPAFIEKTVQLDLENYKPVRFSVEREIAKQYLIEDLGGIYKYNPATDLNKPRVEQIIHENIDRENLEFTPIKAVEEKIEEPVSNKSEDQLQPKIEEGQKIEEKPDLKEEREKLNAEIYNSLKSFFKNNLEQIELNNFLQTKGYKLKEILDFFKIPGNESEFRLVTVTKQIKFLVAKRPSLNRIKRELMQKSKFGIVEKKKKLLPLIELLEKKNPIEISILAEKLNLTEDKLTALLRELEDYGENHVTKIVEEQRSIKVIQKIRRNKLK